MRVVYICAGLGSRLRRSDPTFPKVLLEVGGQSLLGRVVDLFQSMPEVTDPIFVVHKDDPHVRRWVTTWAEGHPVGRPVTIVTQPAADGAAEAIRCVRHFLAPGERALFVFADSILIGQFPHGFPSNGTGLGVCLTADPAETMRNAAITLTQGGPVFIEKPSRELAEGAFCGMGVYLLTREALDVFESVPVRGKERQITDCIAAISRDPAFDFHLLPFVGMFRNLNTAEDVEDAERALSLLNLKD